MVPSPLALLLTFGLISLVHAGNSGSTDDSYGNNSTSSYRNYYNGSDYGTCKVYDKNDFFTVIVQLALATAAVVSLYFKRLRETPRRTFRTWFLDVSKQGFGACYAHVLNMMIANVISRNVRGNNVLNDQCAWYGLSYLIDTTLGLLLALMGLHYLSKVANERDWTHLKNSGVYVEPNVYLPWTLQVMAWMLILTGTKGVIYLLMWLCSGPLAWIGSVLFAPFHGYKHIELLFVMIFFPGVLNVIYFWIADSYLKADASHVGAHEHDESGLQDKKEALLVDGESEMQTVTAAQPPTWTTTY